jgi:nicotinamidase/pyrazinamidase
MTDETDVLFWDVDTQYDFVKPDGKLYVSGAEEREDALEALTEYGMEGDTYMAGSVDAHVTGDEEFEVYPPHCVDGTPGQEKIEATDRDPVYVPVDDRKTADELDEIVAANEDGRQVIFEKRSPDVRDNVNLDGYMDEVDPDAVVVYGVVTEICVDQAMDHFLEEETEVYVVEDAIQHLDEDDRDQALSDWQDRGATFLETDDVIDGRVYDDLKQQDGWGQGI